MAHINAELPISSNGVGLSTNVIIVVSARITLCLNIKCVTIIPNYLLAIGGRRRYIYHIRAFAAGRIVNRARLLAFCVARAIDDDLNISIGGSSYFDGDSIWFNPLTSVTFVEVVDWGY